MRVGSGVQTDATTPNNVRSCWVRVGSGVQTDAITPNNVGSCCVRLHLITFSLSQAWPLFVFLQR